MRLLFLKLFTLLCAISVLAKSRRGASLQRRAAIPTVSESSNGLQQNVTWDQYSFFINGKRLMLFSGEIHPYRMPVQSLHLDIFQKVKAMGLNAVSFYIFWGIHEPKRGEISFEGFRDLQPFFDAAKQAGIYLIARPGPYINAETTAGGFPGWGIYTPGLWRTSNSTYLDAYAGYIKAVGAQIAANEITKGGPVILVQSENEYSGFATGYSEDTVYEAKLMQSLRAAGITVPITTNDAWPGGHYTSVDVYGYDSYPNGFDCSHPYTWGSDAVPDWLWGSHMQFTPNIPNAVYEFQGGAFDGWGGSGYDTCGVLLGPEFERGTFIISTNFAHSEYLSVFYKNQFATSTTFLNLYMIFGGTNWGGIAHPGVYTSYDYGSAISEDRTLREKYYELKLQANFLAVSPAYLTSRPINTPNTQGSFTGNPALRTTQTLDVVGNKTGFYTVRQFDSSVNTVQTYNLTVPTSLGSLTIPTIGGSLALTGKDSKIHVVDYAAGGTTLLYSSAEIMTWATIDGRDIIILYGNAGEVHETAVKFTTPAAPTVKVVSGAQTLKQKTLTSGGSALVLQFTTNGQTVVQVGDKTLLYILDRANAYQFWVLHPPTTGALAQYSTENPIIVKGGYLLRSVALNGQNIALTGDLNATATFEVIAPASFSRVTFNNANLSVKKSAYGTLLTSSRTPSLPAVSLPNLSQAKWKTADSLPEIQSTYSDARWVTANHTTSVNPTPFTTSNVLFAGDYGFHTGNILWRAHFNATGSETGFKVNVQGGAAFGYSVWLDSTSIGSWVGDAVHSSYDGSFNFPKALIKGSSHVITILQDHMGYEEDWTAATDDFKAPRGILSYSFVGGTNTTVSLWKVTGNLGGESYADKTRGPLNEGGLFAERQGWHLPGFNDASWAAGKPTTGISATGVSFYRQVDPNASTTFNLNIPKGVDYPIAVALTNSTANPHFRSQIYVNGYQFGKFVNHVGPQKTFPIPQGILNYQGANTLAVSLWATDLGGAKLDSLGLKFTSRVESSMPEVSNQPLTAWSARPGAY